MENATAATSQRKGVATRASTPWEHVERYASFLVEKFGDRISTKLWDATKDECAEKGIPWLSNGTLKRCLGHYAVCEHAPDEVQRRASVLMKQLSRPDLLDPWQVAPARLCPYCIHRETQAVVANVVAHNRGDSDRPED